jgi:hypothetical protein
MASLQTEYYLDFSGRSMLGAQFGSQPLGLVQYMATIHLVYSAPGFSHGKLPITMHQVVGTFHVPPPNE